MVVAVKPDLEGCSGNMQKEKKKSYLDENVQEANGSVGLCDDGIDVSLQEGFWFEYRLLHSVRSKIRSDLRKEKKKAASKIIQTKEIKFVNQ